MVDAFVLFSQVFGDRAKISGIESDKNGGAVFLLDGAAGGEAFGDDQVSGKNGLPSPTQPAKLLCRGLFYGFGRRVFHGRE